MPLRNIIAERETELPEAEMGKLLKIAEESKDIISLGPGEPDFTPAPHIIKAAINALKTGHTHYSPIEGRHELLEALAHKVKKVNKINANPENIVVTSGSNEAILLSLMSVVDPGEGVLIPDPAYLNYIPTVELLNGNPISLPVIPENDWQLIPELVKKQIKEPKRLRAIVVNTPANPTGAVYTRKTLEAVADIAREHDLLVISDEAYENYVYGGAKHVSIASLNGMEDYVVTLQSFSKTYGMTGFRVGYAVGPQKVIAAMRKLHLYASLTAPTPFQIAAVSALKGPQEWTHVIVRDYDKRRKFLVKRINEIDGFECNDAKGAFYLFPKFSWKMKSVQLVEWFIKNAKVALVPGSDFGRYGDGYLRFSYATAFPKIRVALDRLEKAAKKLK